MGWLIIIVIKNSSTPKKHPKIENNKDSAARSINIWLGRQPKERRIAISLRRA